VAVTGFWPVYRNLKATLDYADNPDKTTLPEYLDEDLYAALRYAENDDKTDLKMFAGGINCSAQNAYAEMIAVQRRFGLRGKVVGYHGIQSFREGEVTPEQAFAIGKETARRMWGDRYQVLVTVHLNTDNVHCHFVVNPVSFKDGTKFKNKIGDHKELRKISDEICREHELSVLENSDFYSKGKKKEYWVHKAGKKTHRDYLREDVEYCLSFATSPREFESQLYALGYTLDPVRFSVKAKHWERAVRLSSIGFSKDRVNAQLRQNAENRYRLFTLEYRPPYKPKKFPLEDELELVRQYLNIQEIRFEDRFVCEIDVDERFQHCIVPKMVLQPLVENAIIHGVADLEEGYIKLWAEADGGDLLLRVSDNGRGIAPEVLARLEQHQDIPGGHLGLTNVDHIIRLYYGVDYGLSASSDGKTGSCVTLRLPMKKGDGYAEGTDR